jgi:hypothetical protein
VGYNTYGEGKVWFVGLNLPYHAVQSRDPLAIQLLSALLQLEPETPAEYTQVPLYGYQAGPSGYRFAYQLEESQALFVPVAHHPGMIVKVDGEPVKNYSYERLLVFDAPAGKRSVEVSVQKSSIYSIGWLVSGFALFALFGIVFYQTHSKVNITYGV